MALSYVKFRRGTSADFKLLTVKEPDTLYFISNPNDNYGSLYLGDKLIAGEVNIGSDISSLKDLSDIALSEEILTNDILVYDEEATAWINKPLIDCLPMFIGASIDKAGAPGLVPAPDANATDLFLRSDGQWANLPIPTLPENNIYVAINTKKETHASLIASTVSGKTLQKNDICIIKDLIANEKYQHTAYVYNGTDWVAMDGNYNASNVYFDEDFIFTKSVGTVTIPSSGNIKVEAAGKNLKEFFAGIFAEEADPTATAPTASISLTSASSVEAGTSYTPSYSITFNKGSYTYGPDTGITATYEVSDTNSNTSSKSSDSFVAFTVTDDTNYKVSATVNYTEGSIPVSNLGNPVENKKIPEGSIDLSTGTVKGYRNAFYGTLTEKGELTSEKIRGLSRTNKDAAAGTVLTINIPKDVYRVVIAYEATLQNLTSVLDKNDSNANIVSGFGDPQIIQVAGANSHNPIDYKVYVMDFANPYDTTNVFTATI